MDLTNQSLKARYIRLRTPAATSKWYAIREFQAETFPADEYAYTNTETYKETIVTINKNEAAIPEVKDVILKMVSTLVLISEMYVRSARLQQITQTKIR